MAKNMTSPSTKPAKMVECKVEVEDCMNTSMDTDEEDKILDDMDCTKPSVTWELVEENGDSVLLVNSLGYMYACTKLKKSTEKTSKEDGKNAKEDGKTSQDDGRSSTEDDIIDWRCTVRSRTINCAARVLQRNDKFIASDTPHCHIPLEGGAEKAKAKIKDRKAKIAKLDALDDELLSQEGDEDLKVIEGDTTDASPTPRKRTGRKRKLPGVNVKTEKEDITPMNIRPLKCEESEASRLYTNLTWEIVENGSNRGNPTLYNSMGYSYSAVLSNREKKRPTTKTFWRCTVRNRKVVCSSRVVQVGNTFKCVGPLHNHGPKQDAAHHARIRALVREGAEHNPAESLDGIVDMALAAAPACPGTTTPPRHLLLKEARNFKNKVSQVTPKPNMGSKAYFEERVSSTVDLEWEILPNASNRGNDLLINKYGYTYTRRKEKNGLLDWRCSVRTKTIACRARVIQKGDKFAPNDHEHCHEPKEGAKAKARLKAALRETLPEDVLVDPSTPSSKLVDAALQQAGVSVDDVGKKDNIIRNLNKRRKAVKEYSVYGGSIADEEHSYTTANLSSTTSGALVQVLQHGGNEDGSILDSAAAEDYDEGDDDADVLMGDECELFGELQQGEDGTLYLYQQPAKASKATNQTTKLKAKIETLEKELQSYKQKVESLQKSANRPMVIKLDKGTVQTVACDHQGELRTLRSFRDAADVHRVHLTKENKVLKKQVEDLQSKYQALSQQMALREAEWYEKEQLQQPEVTVYQSQPQSSVVPSQEGETLYVQAQSLTQNGAPAETFHVPGDLIQGEVQTQTIEVPGELIEGPQSQPTYEVTVTTIPVVTQETL